MKIAILGWGSLIWRPETLHYDKSVDWKENGPQLPIEFARISSDGRLTLVIKKDAANVPTLYAVSGYNDLNVAILNLAVREGCGTNMIGFCLRDEQIFFSTDEKYRFLRSIISSWIENNNEVDAVIWTNLSENFEKNTGKKLSAENALYYLKNDLSPDVQAKAEEYIRKAPQQIDTPIRRAIEAQLGWTHIPTI